MNTALAFSMGAAGMTAGWFIPLMAQKTSAYKLKKNGKALPSDARFTSRLLKVVCLVLNGALWAATGLFTGNILHAALLAVILLDAAVVIIVDIRIRLIPNEAVLIMILAGLAKQISFSSAAAAFAAVITAVVVMVVFIALGYMLGFNTIGAGDVKLAGAMGLTLGYPYILYGLIGMGALILIFCCGGLITRKLTLKSMVAFAPYMMAGTVFAIVANISGF